MKRTAKAIAAGLIFWGLAWAGPVRAEGSGAEDLFYQGWYAETSEGDLEKAIGLYRKAVEREREEQGVAARAQLQIGACLEKLGRGEEAKAAYRAVLDRFGGQRETAEKASARLREIDGPAAGKGGKEGKGQAHGGILADLGSEDPQVFDAAYSLLAALGPDGGGELRRGLEGLEEKERTRVSLALDAADAGLADGPSARMWQIAHTMKVDINFENAPLVDIVAYLRDLSRMNLVIDGGRVKIEGLKSITFVMRDIALAGVLKLLAAQYGMEVVYSEGVISLSTPAGAAEMRAGAKRRAAERRAAAAHPAEAGSVEAKLRDQLASQRVNLNFEAAPFADVIAFLRDFTGLNFVIDSNTPGLADRPVTLRVSDLSLDRCLSMICETNDAEWTVKDGIIWIGGRR